MITKFLCYEKKDLTAEKVYSALKRIPYNIIYLKITKQLAKTEIEEIQLRGIESLLDYEFYGNIREYIIMTENNILITLGNHYSIITNICVNAEEREDIIKIKDILEKELELKESKR